MLRRMGLRNFKCWRELDVELAPITLFFGANSSGKTALLQSLLMLKQTAQSRNQIQPIDFGGGEWSLADLGSYQELVFSHNSEIGIGMCLSWAKEGPILAEKAGAYREDYPEYRFGKGDYLDYEVAFGKGNGIFVTKLAYKAKTLEGDSYEARVMRRDDGTYAYTFPSGGQEKEQLTTSMPKSCYGLPDNSGFSGLIASSEFLQLMECTRYLGPLRIHPQRIYQWTGNRFSHFVEPDGSDTIQFLIGRRQDAPELLKKVVRSLANIGIAEDFQLRPIDQDELFYRAVVTIAGTDSSLTDVGFGVSQVLPVITMLLSAPEGSIVLLEQPELHLHPNAQAALADLFIQVSEQRQLQLIIECHSEHIVRRLQRRIAEDQPAFACPGNIKMYFCQPGENGSTATQLDLDRFGQINNWPDKFLGDTLSDMFSMSRAALERRAEELQGG